jgi:hypothetical protein
MRHIALRAPPPRRPGYRTGRVGEVEQVRPLGDVQPQSPGDALQHLRRSPADRAALHTGVILHTQPSQGSHFTTAQTMHAPVGPGRQSNLLRRNLGATRNEELAYFRSIVHAIHAKPTPAREGVPPRACLGDLPARTAWHGIDAPIHEQEQRPPWDYSSRSISK